MDKEQLPGGNREEQKSRSSGPAGEESILPEPKKAPARRSAAGDKNKDRAPKDELSPQSALPELPDEEEEKQGEKQRKKRRVVTALVLLGVVVLLGLAVGLMFLFPELFDLDRFIRFFRYMGLRNKEGYGVITYEAGADNVYAGFDGCLAVGNESGMTLYDLQGEQEAVIQSTLTDPLLAVGEKICAVYSPGTGYIGAFGRGGKELLDKTVSGTVLDVDVSDDGYLCYLASESGYKSTATMFSAKQELQFRLTSRTRYLNTCAVSERGRNIAVASLGEKDSVFRSEITILRTSDKLDDLDSEDSSAVRVDLGNQVIYDLRFMSDGCLCAIGQKNVTFLNTEGKIYRQISLENNPLIGYDFSSKGFAVILQRIGLAGENYRITTLDNTGEELGTLELNERVRSLSACERYVAVLTEREAVIYRRNLKKYAATEQVGAAVRIIARPDGTCLLVSGTEATLYIP